MDAVGGPFNVCDRSILSVDDRDGGVIEVRIAGLTSNVLEDNIALV